jgi:hypothetical protein
MEAQTPQIASDFFSDLREREAQARAFGARHLVAVPGTDSMLYWLADACTRARKLKGRKQVHVAANVNGGRDQSTIARFEDHKAWPRDPDEIVRAYAEDLDVKPSELWAAAIALWQADEAKPAAERAVAAAKRTRQRARVPRQAARKDRSGARPDTTGR